MTDVNIQANGVDISRLSTLRVAELQALAGELGIQGASKLRKGELVDAITANQSHTTESAPGADSAPAAPAAATTVEDRKSVV